MVSGLQCFFETSHHNLQPMHVALRTNMFLCDLMPGPPLARVPRQSFPPQFSAAAHAQTSVELKVFSLATCVIAYVFTAVAAFHGLLLCLQRILHLQDNGILDFLGIGLGIITVCHDTDFALPPVLRCCQLSLIEVVGSESFGFCAA